MDNDDKINKSIRSSMNDDLLGEGDKKAEPKPVAEVGRKSSEFVWCDKKMRYVPRQKTQSTFDWDDDSEFDRMFGSDAPTRDRGIDPYPHGGRRTTIAPSYSSTPSYRNANTYFKPTPMVMEEVVLTDRQVSDVVDEMMRTLAVLNDELGIVWSSNGVIGLRKTLVDLVSGEVYVAQADGTYKKSVSGGFNG